MSAGNPKGLFGAELLRLGPGEGTPAAAVFPTATAVPVVAEAPEVAALKPCAEKLTLCGMPDSATCWKTEGIIVWPPGGYSL